jgi:hypothetical protein
MAKTPEGYRLYPCGFKSRLARAGGLFCCAVAACLLVLLVSRPPAYLPDKWMLQSIPKLLRVLYPTVASAPVWGIPLLVGMILMHLWPDVGVGEEGLAVQTYFFSWTFIGWEDLVDVVPLRHPLRLLGAEADVVLVKHLTFWHRLISHMYNGTWTPAFMITSDHRHRDELLATIMLHCDGPGSNGQTA